MSMITSVSLRKSLADVTKRKGRTLFAILSIFLGVFALTCVNFTEETLFSAYTYSLGLNTDRPDITQQVDTIDTALMPQILTVPNVQKAQFFTAFRTLWSTTTGSRKVTLSVSSSPDLQNAPFTPVHLISGRYPDVGEIVLENSDKNFQSFSIGDTITVTGGQGTSTLKVVGLAQTPGQDSSSVAFGYMSDTGLHQLAQTATVSQFLMAKVSQISLNHQTASALASLLQAHQIHVLSTDFPRTPTLVIDQVNGVFTVLRLAAILAIILSACIILNSVTILITEQTAIIGTMKAIGGTRSTIMRGYLVSIAIYAVLGTLVGLVLGLVGGDALAFTLAGKLNISLGPFTVSPTTVLLSLIVGLSIPLLAACWPLWNGTRISVRDALAAYGVGKGQGRSLFVRFGQRLTWISQITWLGMRDIFRRRWRATLTLVMLTLVAASFLVVQIASNSVNTTVAQSNARLDADLRVQMGWQIGMHIPFSQVEQQLNALPNVAHMEPFWVQQADSTWGQLKVLGVEPTTQLYHYQLTGGRWLRPGETNAILLSDEALAVTKLHIGSTLTLQNQNAQSTTWTIIGTVKQPPDTLGQIGAAVMNLTDLYHFEGLPSDVVPEIVIQCHDRSSQAVNQLARQAELQVQSPATPTSEGRSNRPPVQVDLIQNVTLGSQKGWYVLYYLLYGVALILGLAGVIALATTLTASVIERQREIGILRAMGAHGWQVGRVFWIEGLTLSSIAWGLSILLGIPLAYLFIQAIRQLVLPVEFSFDPFSLVIMLAVVVVIATLASLIPSWYASRVRIVSILHYE